MTPIKKTATKLAAVAAGMAITATGNAGVGGVNNFL